MESVFKTVPYGEEYFGRIQHHGVVVYEQFLQTERGLECAGINQTQLVVRYI